MIRSGTSELVAEITLQKLRVGKARTNLRFWRDGEVTRHEALAVEGEMQMEPRADRWRARSVTARAGA